MKTLLIATIMIVFVCGCATALSYLFGARGHALQMITIVTWGLSIVTGSTVATLSLIRKKTAETKNARM